MPYTTYKFVSETKTRWRPSLKRNTTTAGYDAIDIPGGTRRNVSSLETSDTQKDSGKRRNNVERFKLITIFFSYRSRKTLCTKSLVSREDSLYSDTVNPLIRPHRWLRSKTSTRYLLFNVNKPRYELTRASLKHPAYIFKTYTYINESVINIYEY